MMIIFASPFTDDFNHSLVILFLSNMTERRVHRAKIILQDCKVSFIRALLFIEN